MFQMDNDHRGSLPLQPAHTALCGTRLTSRNLIQLSLRGNYTSSMCNPDMRSTQEPCYRDSNWMLLCKLTLTSMPFMVMDSPGVWVWKWLLHTQGQDLGQPRPPVANSFCLTMLSMQNSILNLFKISVFEWLWGYICQENTGNILLSSKQLRPGGVA